MVLCVLLVFRLVVVCLQILSGYSDGTLRATGVSIGCCMSSDNTIRSCTSYPSSPVEIRPFYNDTIFREIQTAIPQDYTAAL